MFYKTTGGGEDIPRTRKKETGPSIVWLQTKYEHLSMCYIVRIGVDVTMDKNKRDMEWTEKGYDD